MPVDSKYTEADAVQCLIARYYQREHGHAYVSIGNMPYFDIQFADKVTMEVKVDLMAAGTLNAAVEFWNVRRDNPSGVLSTTANLWLHCVPENDGLRCYEIQTKKLLKLCLEAGEVKTGGDGDGSRLKIIPLQRIREISNQDFFLSNQEVKP